MSLLGPYTLVYIYMCTCLILYVDWDAWLRVSINIGSWICIIWPASAQIYFQRIERWTSTYSFAKLPRTVLVHVLNSKLVFHRCQRRGCCRRCLCRLVWTSKYVTKWALTSPFLVAITFGILIPRLLTGPPCPDGLVWWSNATGCLLYWFLHTYMALVEATATLEASI